MTTSVISARDADVRQYSLARILAVWAAAALPMGVPAWVVAPWLGDQLGGDEPLAQALLLLLTAGLVWQFLLVMILIRHELGTLRWSRVRAALWLRAPRDPKTGRVGGRVWWWVLPFLVLFGLEQVLPGITGPVSRDFGEFLGSDRGEEFFRGAWGWFAVVVVLDVFNTVLGEELLFRGPSAAANAGCLWKGRLCRQRGAVRGLPPAHSMGDPHRPGGHHRPRLSLAAVRERVDGDHRPLGAECLHRGLSSWLPCSGNARRPLGRRKEGGAVSSSPRAGPCW